MFTGLDGLDDSVYIRRPTTTDDNSTSGGSVTERVGRRRFDGRDGFVVLRRIITRWTRRAGRLKDRQTRTRDLRHGSRRNLRHDRRHRRRRRRARRANQI